MTQRFTVTRYEGGVALGKVLRLSAYDASWHTSNVVTLFERVIGCIDTQQYFFIRDAHGDVGFVAWGHLSRESLARFVGNIWPISPASSLREKRYIFIALSPFIDWSDLEQMLREQAAADKIEWWMRDANAPALIKLSEK